MVGDITKTDQSSQFAPDRRVQHDLFICDVADAVLKDLIAEMEHPFYSLSKKPETTVRRYEHNGNWIEIVPSVKGLATIYDKDILIYCISQIMHKMKNGEPYGQRIKINAYDLLTFTNKGTGGREYAALCEGLDRLDGTRIRTNIKTGDEEQFDTFGLIDAATVRRKYGLDGRLMHCEVKLSDWVFSAIKAQEVLTLHRDYFRLKRPIERRIYELARKHCGKQPEWRCSVGILHKKSGSKATLKEFRRAIRRLVADNEIVANDELEFPDYAVELDTGADMVVFSNKALAANKGLCAIDLIRLDPETYHDAREIAQGWDVHYLEQEWRDWMAMGSMDTPDKPDRAFLGFCRKWVERRGRP